MPKFSPLCRQHADERRLAGALRLGGFSDPDQAARLKRANHSLDRRALTALLQDWGDPDQRLAPLQARDLLGVAVAMDLPHAMTAWMAAGEILHADTLLAFMLTHTESPPQTGVWQHLADSVAPEGPCSAWAGVMMTHVILAGWDEQAKDLLIHGVGPSDAIPLRMSDAHEWLWTLDAREQNQSDATTPFHLALREGRWALAEEMCQGGAPTDLEDGRGVRPLNEVNDFLQQREDMNARFPHMHGDDDLEQAVAWRERLITQERAKDLDEALGAVDEVSEGSGRRRL